MLFVVIFGVFKVFVALFVTLFVPLDVFPVVDVDAVVVIVAEVILAFA